MTRSSRLAALSAALVASMSFSAFALAQEVDDTTLDLAREAAHTGWATAEGGTTGGAEADDTQIYVVTTRAELVDALGGDVSGNRDNDEPAIIFISGTIDLTEDDDGNPQDAEAFAHPDWDWHAYLAEYDPAVYGMEEEPAGPLEDARAASQQAQAEHINIYVGSNKTLFGLGDDAVIRHGSLRLNGVSNVIIRNIEFQDSFDMFPGWDGTDGSEGNWNSEYDNIEIRESTHVWLDHNTFNDGDRPDWEAGEVFGRVLQHHDGVTDIVAQSNYVTFSWNKIDNHDKTHIIGNSDSRTDDADHLKVTLHHNHYINSGQRAPRVRFGEVHVFNNLHEHTADSQLGFVYSYGVGLDSHIYAEANAFVMPDVAPDRTIRPFNGEAIHVVDTLFNGEEIDLLEAFNAVNPDARLDDTVGWSPQYAYELTPVAEVEDAVRSGAGSGNL
ncbi:pectate lyase family protein [Pelagibacterium luteolum]|uniref:Pectate lyase n=1 Tax=Pelagibacterium luteolum TaxID=440168 RepID=A0A1G7TLD7_9HYPH|nr:hypothetical protein [Pelagibacterium luteolum]SDG36138.1 pectate lyase [Pelagibacterium luteolum]